MSQVAIAKRAARWGGLGLALTALPAVESEQYLKGEMLFEAVNQNNYRDGNKDARDRAAQLWMRAKLGAKVELQDQVKAQMTLVYDAEAGDDSANDTAAERGEVRVDDAYVLLKSFLHEDLHVRVGRQPIAFNLRTDHGGFLFDSRSHIAPDAPRPTVTGWDGLTAYVQRDSWNMKLIPFIYILDEAREAYGALDDPVSTSKSNMLYGATLDWKPDGDGEDRLFLSATLTWEDDPSLGGGIGGGGQGEDLQSYYLGISAKLNKGFDVWAEGAYQDGDLDDDIGFKGWGVSGGLRWKVPGDRDAGLSVQYDLMSGDDTPTDDDYEAFVNTWEGTSDTLIVEHERYGELSELVVGNLEAIKFKLEWGFFSNRLSTRVVAARYKFAEDVGGEDEFGDEFDLHFDFQYNDYTRISFFGGAFLPGDGYEEAAAAVFGSDTDDDMVHIYGAALQVLF